MSTTNDPSNIVHFGSHRGPRDPQVGKLLGDVLETVTTQLGKLADHMFEHVDDTLFDLAEKAESNAVQTQYFDGMRDVRKKRALIERQFMEQVRHAVSHVTSGPHVHGDDAAAILPGAPGELSLVDDSELEESLAIASMTSKAQGRLARPLYAVKQRLSVICGGAQLTDANNPIGPATLCDAFRQAMRELNVETRVRLIIYKLFDRYVMADLGGLYATINGQLAQAGVLPRLRHELPGQRPRSGHAGASRREPATSATTTVAPDAGGDFQAEFYQMLNNLLATRRHAISHDIGSDVPSLSPAELLGALSLLQNQVAVTSTAAEDEPDIHGDSFDSSFDAIDIDQLKARLLQQISRLRGNARARVSGADEDTIDLVGMLFEFILEDRNLPAQMQAMLARLQIPYLKAAILDRRMFAHASHPARRLLDALAEAAKGWSEDSDRDRRLYAKIRAIVETLLQEFDDDMDIFARQEQELAEFTATSRKRAELSEQRVAEAVRGREKLQQARRRAAREILTRMGPHELPELIRGILTRAWANYLVLAQLRQGEDSKEFRVALRFVDDFVWSALPMRNQSERQRLRQLLPLLEKSLRHGLATVAFQDSDVETLMLQLNMFYRRQLGEAEPAPDAAGADIADLPIPEAIETIARPDVAQEPDATATRNRAETAAAADVDPHMQRVRSLKVGTWLEFADGKDAASPPERAKLSWISPISGKYLFVNRRGLKVADKTAAQMASEFAAGTAIVLEELPLFDRALDAIVERLRQTQDKRKQAQTDTRTDDTPRD